MFVGTVLLTIVPELAIQFLGVAFILMLGEVGLRTFDNRNLKYIKGEPHYFLGVQVLGFVSGASVLALLMIGNALGV